MFTESAVPNETTISLTNYKKTNMKTVTSKFATHITSNRLNFEYTPKSFNRGMIENGIHITYTR